MTDNGKQPDLATEDDERVRAAIRIQRLWRQKNTLTARYMTTNLRWLDALERAKLQAHRNAASEGKNNPRARWKRAVLIATKLQDGNQDLGLPGPSDEGATLKELEAQHWLELVDGKHRYGSNLKWYHRRWKEADTKENFFQWLDAGGGKELSLKECPRSQLEKERIFYLSAEQRLNYLVKIDKEGKLRWARNNRFVDTTAGHWKDAGNGQGIIPEDLSLKVVPISGESRSSSKSSQAQDPESAAAHYVGTVEGRYRWSRSLKKYLTIHGIFNQLLRKTVKRNTWIYISDKNFNIFIGIKVTGEFQHSSFLAGGLVTSAGLISVKNGMIHTISPLSGHYRTSIDHFHKFIAVLVERGIDMRKAKISKAEAALWGIEHLAKWKKKESNLISQSRHKAKEGARKLISGDALDASKWKLDILRGRHNASEVVDEREACAPNQHPSPAEGSERPARTHAKSPIADGDG